MPPGVCSNPRLAKQAEPPNRGRRTCGEAKRGAGA
jgi:hypothetical protein